MSFPRPGAARLLPLALVAVALATACEQPREAALDLTAPRELSFACDGHVECWTFAPSDAGGWSPPPGDVEPAVSGFGLSGAMAETGLRSPKIDTRDGATLVLRARSLRPLRIAWEVGTDSRALRTFERARPWWTTRLAAIVLPKGETGRVALSVSGPGARTALRASDLEITFAEVLRPERGRCYRDHVRLRGNLRDVVACVPPATAVLPFESSEPRRLRIGVADTARGGGRALSVSTGPNETPLVLEPSQDGWREVSREVPAAGGTAWLRFRSTGSPGGGLLLWTAHLAPPAREGTRPNVILYLVDTLRADALSAYGASRPTPSFDALARQGALFVSAIAPSPWTLPSVVSLFTGRDVIEHGVASGRDTRPPGMSTLAEHFRAAGYTTAAVATNPWISARHGLNAGFAEFIAIRPMPPGRAKEGSTSARVSDVILPWMEAQASTPFLLYVHVMDPHQPYTPPPQIERRVLPRAARNDAVIRLARTPSDGRSPERLGEVERLDPSARRSIMAISRTLYDATVAGCDLELGRLLSALDDLDLTAKTIVVATADHGEEFLEHGMTGHSHSLYRELLHVPLLMRYPGVVPAGRVVDGDVGLIDLAPTLLALAGLPADPGMSGRDLSGSLRDAGRVTEARPLFIVRRPSLQPIHGIPPMDGVIDGKWKLIVNRRADGVERELYDRTADPGESTNLATRQLDVTRRLSALIETARQGSAKIAGLAEPLDEDTRDRLRALGYAVD